MIERSVPGAKTRRRRDRAMHEVERIGHGAFERPAEGEPCGDRGRQCAAGAMRRRRVDAVVREPAHGLGGDEDVDERRRVGEVTALDERGARAEPDDRAAGALHLFRRADRIADQNLRLVQIRRHECGERNELPLDERLGVSVEEPVAGCRNHDGIEHVVRDPMNRDAIRDDLHDLGRAEHPALRRGGRQITGQRVDLASDEGGGERLPRLDADGVLGGDGGYRRGSKDAELMKRLEVGLQSRGAARVGTGYRERDSHEFRSRALAKATEGAIFGAPWTGMRTRIASNLQSTVRDLQRRKARGRRGLAVLEGVRLVEEALAAGLEFKGALVSPDLTRTTRGQALTEELANHAVAVEEVGARAFSDLAGTDTPQGILAVVQPRAWALADVTGSPILVLDGVQDPGNVGTLIRTAHALGAAASLLLRGSADPMNPKALRAAMGATFRHPVVQLDDGPFITWAQARGITLWASAADGVPIARALDSRRSRPSEEIIAVIVGNEGAGIRPQLNEIAAQRVAIPLARGAESLNVAVAAGILLYEVLRGG